MRLKTALGAPRLWFRRLLQNATISMGGPYFTLFIIAELVSNTGDGIYTVAIPAAMYQIMPSPLALAALQAIHLVPHIVFGLVAGYTADRFSRKKIILLTYLLATVQVFILAFLILTSVMNPFYFMLLAFIGATGATFYYPALQGLIPQLVNRQNLATANAQLQTIYGFAAAVGPAVGGYLVAQLGAGPALVVDAMTFVFAILVIGLIPQRQNGRKPSSPTILSHSTYALKLILDHPILWFSIGMGLLIAVAIATSRALLPYLVLSETGRSATTLGLVLGAGSLGSLVGGLLAIQLLKKIPVDSSLKIATLSILLATMGLAVAQTWPIAAGIWFALLIAQTFSLISLRTIWQAESPDEYLGTVVGITRTITRLCSTAAILLAGLMAEGLGARATLAIAAGSLGLGALILLAFRLYQRPRKVQDHNSERTTNSEK